MNTELDNQSVRQSFSHLVIPSVSQVCPSVRQSLNQSVMSVRPSVRLSVNQSVSQSFGASFFQFFAFHESGEGKDSSRTG